MKQWTDVMVDIETTGTQPDRTAILQIAAVKFNFKTREVNPDFFNRCLTIPPNRFWAQDTASWWATQKNSILLDILSKQEDYQVVINDFADWAYLEGGLRFWSKPTTFDYMFIASYMNDCNLINPFHYRSARDLASFLEGLHHPNEVPKIEYKNFGDAHNALSDTLSQLQFLFDHLDKKAAKDD